MSKIVTTINNGCFMVGLIGGGTSMVILIVIVAMFRSCFVEQIDPIDDSYMTQREMYDRQRIADSTGVGFELIWYTTKPVTEMRMKEIKTREHISASYKKLRKEAADHFQHDLFNTDIYDFVEYAKKFDVDPDVRLVNIFVYGQRLTDQYLRPNPNLPNGGCTKPYQGTDQGDLYLKEYDIYVTNPNVGRSYRYWKCQQTSSTDERYTHFTESERKQGNYGTAMYTPKYNHQ